MTSDVVIHIGGLHVSRDGAVIKTVLGSCIAVCLHDPVARIGGMNHFMLPFPGDHDGDAPTRFGVHAMETLIDEIHRVGGDRRRLAAKIFGGAHVLCIRESENSVPRRNVRFIEEYISCERIPILSRDLGGSSPRRIHFDTASGKVYVKYLSPGARCSARLAAAERDAATAPPRVWARAEGLLDEDDDCREG